MTMATVLREFIDSIEATGGVVQGEDGICYPRADPTWSDLGSIYLKACEVAGVQPMIIYEADGEDNDLLNSTFI